MNLYPKIYEYEREVKPYELAGSSLVLDGSVVEDLAVAAGRRGLLNTNMELVNTSYEELVGAVKSCLEGMGYNASIADVSKARTALGSGGIRVVVVRPVSGLRLTPYSYITAGRPPRGLGRL
jgi:hypothetical protein